MEPISITALNRYVKSLLDNNEILADLTISAELASFHLHRKTGHCYFILKDNESSIKAVMFDRDAKRLSFVPEDGMQLLVRAKATIYQKDGSFQLYVTHMFLDGAGALNAAFLQMKQRLEKRGFFLQEHKKTLPQVPACIGLVTSKDGAALHDILAVARRRSITDINFVLYDVPVQGAAAAKPIADAIERLDKLPYIDIIVVARGGGSAEDLFVFNSELIAEAIFNATTPIMSAIGHEIDTVISDLVADIRAATPTAAAEIILPDPSQLLYRYSKAREGVSLDRVYREINNAKLTTKDIALELNEQLSMRLKNNIARVENLMHRLTAYNPANVLKKGYAVMRSENKIVSDDIIKKGDRIELETSKLYIECSVEDIKRKN